MVINSGGIRTRTYGGSTTTDIRPHNPSPYFLRQSIRNRKANRLWGPQVFRILCMERFSDSQIKCFQKNLHFPHIPSAQWHLFIHIWMDKSTILLSITGTVVFRLASKKYQSRRKEKECGPKWAIGITIFSQITKVNVGPYPCICSQGATVWSSLHYPAAEVDRKRNKK